MLKLVLLALSDVMLNDLQPPLPSTPTDHQPFNQHGFCIGLMDGFR